MNQDLPLNTSTGTAAGEEPVTDQALTGVPDSAQSIEMSEQPASAGAQLAGLREARGWSIVQVANQLNLAPRQIDALERDHYAALPGMVIVRGFIRTYAKLLQADPAPILSAVKDEAGASPLQPHVRPAMSASFSETQFSDKRRFPVKTLAVMAIMLIAGAVVYQAPRLGWRMPGTGAHSSPAVLMPVTEANVTEAQPAAVTPIENTAPSSLAAGGNAAVNASQGERAVVPSASKRKEPAPVVTEGKNVLAVHVRQDSWIEVRRADDSVLFAGLLKAGAAESLDLNGPVSVVIGNAAGVDLTLRGAPVDIKGSASNVARLNLK
jgi:cytoskeleton protein RodZ